MRVRLTDQALVAVTTARAVAASASREAGVVDLIIALAGEPDGVAGMRLAGSAGGVSALVGRAPAAPRLPSLDIALRWSSGEVTGRPLWTSDLLRAAIEIGGSDLADLLRSVGLDPSAVAADLPPARRLMGGPVHAPEQLAETYALGSDPELDGAAGRALARTRALGGAATVLLAALTLESVLDPAGVPLDHDRLDGGFFSLDWPDDDTDVALAEVLDAARRIAEDPALVTARDLVRALALSGGPTVAALLAEEVA